VNIWSLAAIATVLSVLTKPTLHVNAAGLSVSVYVPWVLLALAVSFLAVLAWIIARHARFRSSPYPRPVITWST
jgi:uncharacterized membrane protein YjgN (DUF898 family)